MRYRTKRVASIEFTVEDETWVGLETRLRNELAAWLEHGELSDELRAAEPRLDEWLRFDDDVDVGL